MSVEPARHLFTVDEYERMAEVGLLPDRHLELLAGEIIDVSPIGSRHAQAVRLLTEWFIVHTRGRAVVSVQSPLRLNDLSEPEPDVAMLRPPGEVYGSRHPRPEDVLLLIEVAETSTPWDRRVKRPLYAAAGVVEMWIVDLRGEVVEVATEPSPTGYAHVETVVGGQDVVPVIFPELSFPVAEILG